MREIEFRGERIYNGEWVYGDYLSRKNKLSIYPNIIFHDSEFIIPRAFEIYYETLGQYIGLKDKNKVKIFEGDKLEVYYSTPDGESHRIEVIVDEIDNFKLMLDLENSDSLEIIGNIHDEVEQ